jgi:cytosine/uracil/thiamine/allantoin permease
MKDLAKVNNNATIWVLLSESSCQVQYNCLNEAKCQVWCLLQKYFGYKIFHFVNAIVLNETQYDINYLRDLQCMITCSAFFCLVWMLGESKSALYACHQFACVHLLRLQVKAMDWLCHQHFLIRMIVTFSTCSYQWLPLWLQTKFLTENTLNLKMSKSKMFQFQRAHK